MSALPRVELQAEVGTTREQVFALLSTSDGLERWIDGAEIGSAAGDSFRLVLGEGVAVGEIAASSPPQHISFDWDWEGEPLGVPSVVAFDLIDHGRRTHLTLRHVGFADRDQREFHEALWRHWFVRMVRVADGREPDA